MQQIKKGQIKVGSKILWCDEEFEVIEIDKKREYGKVKDGNGDITKFQFNFMGEKSTKK